MRSFFLYTRREKQGAIAALNLFFGALLGANLGSLDGLGLRDYTHLVILLAGTVTFLRLVSTSERRGFVLAMCGAYGLLLAGVMAIPALWPKGMDPADLQRLLATLAIWVVFVLLTEFSPVIEHKAKPGARTTIRRRLGFPR